MAFKRSFALLFVLAAAVLALPHDTTSAEGPASCGKGEFWYPTKSCCLPHGGKPKPPPPPPGKSCPPTTWYWHAEKSCCVPNYPPPPSPPPPQCRGGYDWNKATQCCEPGRPTPTHTPHKPSPTPPSGGYGDGYGGGDQGGDHDRGHTNGKHQKADAYKRSTQRGGHAKRRVTALCPARLEACPVGGLGGSDYECLDTTLELGSCGGCASTGTGQDCTAIEGSWNVACEVGSCKVYTCRLGYKVAPDGKSCVEQ